MFPKTSENELNSISSWVFANCKTRPLVRKSRTASQGIERGWLGLVGMIGMSVAAEGRGLEIETSAKACIKQQRVSLLFSLNSSSRFH